MAFERLRGQWQPPPVSTVAPITPGLYRLRSQILCNPLQRFIFWLGFLLLPFTVHTCPIDISLIASRTSLWALFHSSRTTGGLAVTATYTSTFYLLETVFCL
jgi:hypothetical protein